MPAYAARRSVPESNESKVVTSTWTLVADGVSAPEGPTLGPDGWILNVCSFSRPENPRVVGGDIVATHPDRPGDTRRLFNTSFGGVEGIPAALAFGPDGCLYVTDEGHRAILRANDDGELTVHIRSPNGPNDLSFDSNGNLWFTDPWGSDIDNAIGCVYVLPSGERALEQVAEGLAFPNGIVTTDEKVIYAETRTNRLWCHRRVPEGGLGAAELFAELSHQHGVEVQGPDGMCLDVQGNLYVAHFGAGCVRILDSYGTELDCLAVPGCNPTNLCFGGADMATLFVTLDDTDEVVARRAPHAGASIQFCPQRQQHSGACDGWIDFITRSPAL